MNCHVLLLSYDAARPPSLPMMMWSELFGSIQIAWMSSCVTSAASVSNVRPPSTVICKPTPPMYTPSGLFGSTRTWLKYIGRGLLLLTLRHVCPASSVRYTPVSPPPTAGWPPPPRPPPAGSSALSGAAPRPRPPGPSMDAYTVLPFFRYASSPMRPSGPVGKPFVRRVQLSPPSTDFQMPLPGPPPFMQHAVRRR